MIKSFAWQNSKHLHDNAPELPATTTLLDIETENPSWESSTLV
jgi:hypothetical protein